MINPAKVNHPRRISFGAPCVGSRGALSVYFHINRGKATAPQNGTARNAVGDPVVNQAALRAVQITPPKVCAFQTPKEEIMPLYPLVAS
jgi:hypothetical protein